MSCSVSVGEEATDELLGEAGCCEGEAVFSLRTAHISLGSSGMEASEGAEELDMVELGVSNEDGVQRPDA